MDLIRKIFNRKFVYFYSFLLLLLVFLYFYNRYDQEEISYALIYIIFGMLISLFYILKDFIYTPDKLNYRQIIMQDALFNHKGEIIEEFEAYPLYQEFVTFHLNRKSEDPYSDTVTSLQAVRFIKNRMIDSLFIPIHPTDPLLDKYTLPLNEAIGRFLRYAGDRPIIIYNQPFTHTYLNIKLDKEVHISFIDAMKMSKDLYGIANKPLSLVRKYLKLYNLEGDYVSDAKVIGAIYLDYIYTVSKYRTKEARRTGKKAFPMEKAPLAETPSVIKQKEAMLPTITEPPVSEKKKAVLSTVTEPPVKEQQSVKEVKEAKEPKGITVKVPEEERRIISHEEPEKKLKASFDPELLNNFGKSISGKLTHTFNQIKSKFEVMNDRRRTEKKEHTSEDESHNSNK